ncbi:MAG: 2-oxo acid dehydrogenase subunit E2 [Polyangiaceae bacterium]|nr:2-oxo acid dehydrogenase subunit E2 [Polyangiaceae bacterium]
MSRYEFKLPDIGEGVTEGEIVKWLVEPGEAIAEDQPMVEVMTDKATVPITSPKSGRVVELRGRVGDVVAVHGVLVVLELPGGEGAAAPGSDGPAATAVGDIREDLPGVSLLLPTAPAAGASGAGQRSGRPDGRPAAPASYFNAKPLATPATRKLARDLGVDLRTVAPSGPSGRVVKDDVRGASVAGPAPVAARAPAPALPGGAPAATAPGAPSTSVGARPAAPAEGIASAGLERRTPLRGLRKRIFEQMGRSKQTAAHFTFVEECDVSALKASRERLAPLAAASGVKLTYLAFIVKACVAALKKHPALNAAFDERTQEIVERGYYDIGIASATEAGLMVPVVRAVDQKNLLEVARDIQRLSAETKAGTIKADDLRGSTFTVTSLGALGGYFATPILNHPEVAILGVHRIKERPVVRDGAIAIGEVMLLSLSFDHRLIDGHRGAAFAYELIGYLESPDKLWLEGG